MQHDEKKLTPEELGHEPIEVSATTVAKGFGWLFGSIAVSLILMAILAAYFATADGGPATVQAPTEKFELPKNMPGLDANQRSTLRELRGTEKKILTEYEWLDAETGVARIPIRRAMELMAQRGANPEAPQDTPAPQNNVPTNP